MKRRLMFILGCMFITLAIAGCSGSSSDSNTRPSSEVFPFGAASMNFEFDDYYNNDTELIYDNQGRVVAINTTTEIRNEGRVEGIMTTNYTIDPTLVVTQVPELEDMDRMRPAALAIQGMALDALALPQALSLHPQETLAPQAKGPLFFMGLPDLLDHLPGAVVKVTINFHSYDAGWGLKSTPIPDEMVKNFLITMNFAYEQDGRPSKITVSFEVSEVLYTYTMTCTYENGRLIRTAYVQRADYYHDGWIDENLVTEVKFDYDENGRLIQKTVEDLSYGGFSVSVASYNMVTTYTYDASGRLIEKVETDGDDIYTTTYTYDETGRTLTKTDIDTRDDNPEQELERRTHTYTYGAFGPTSYSYEVVTSGSETVDLYTYAYDEDGRIEKRVHMRDNGNDGADSFKLFSWTYDASGRLVQIEETSHSADGDTPGPITGARTTAFSYDAQNRLAQVAFESESDKQVFSYSYDEAGASAAVALQYFSWDSESGAFIEYGPEERLDFTFISGVPTGAMELRIDEFPLGESEYRHEMIPVTVKVPAMYSLSFFAMELGWSGMLR